MTQATPVRKVKRARRSETDGQPTVRRLGAGNRAIMNNTTCEVCHEYHKTRSGQPSCTGHKRNKDEPCTNPPMEGGRVCRMHGGAAPQTKSKAELRVLYASVEGEVAALLRECDMPDQHPIDGLLEVVRHTGSMARLLGTLCAALDLKPSMVFEHGEDGARYRMVKPGIYGYNHLDDQAPHVLIILYGQWQDRYARACKLALDANIDERLVRNAEATTGAVYQVIEEALEACDLSPNQMTRFGKVFAAGARKMIDPFGQSQPEEEGVG